MRPARRRRRQRGHAAGPDGEQRITTAPHDFADLLQAVGAVDGLRRLRFTSPYPTDFTPGVDRGDGRRCRPSASTCTCPRRAARTRCCKRMLRRYTPRAVPRGARVAARGDSRPHLHHRPDRRLPGRDRRAVRGHPLPRDRAPTSTTRYTFKYSAREGTPAERIRDHVDDEVASARLSRLVEAVRDNARRKHVGRVGEVHEILVERPA
ncbi:MAG: hypothetical protein MZU79_00530, partial [Anaerotruncus sp.]|nr:hypothetical protein [Anaerotruncus sp.]